MCIRDRYQRRVRGRNFCNEIMSNNRDLVKQQKKYLEDQDEELDEIDKTLEKIKGIGKDIGQEADTSIKLLDQIGEKTDVMDTRLRIASHQTNQVRVESSTKGLWIVICILILVLVIVLVLAYGL
eukprot:TRINITY_DN1564_c0_g1_i4.p1 TRINITY_DN1564_c0_g1~~TRINITY_DN1564_c0_g1_i4.p1  ORF type:complete len:125 (+),score=23.29 TRINITY_DN1564_c0_g1_i4:1-375(+)